jgi:L-fucose isomerase-like protein
LFEDKELIWACEADTMSLLTKYIVYKSTRAPVMMTNVYPFLMGMAALKHEKIERFPDLAEPENHLLLVHCGYFGLLPKCFSEKWNVTSKVLEIVDDNAIALDAQYSSGDVTLITMHPSLDKILVYEGLLEGYAQYPGSDCRNGGIVRVQDGYKLIDKLYSHHSIIIKGNLLKDMNYVAKIFDLQLETV